MRFIIQGAFYRPQPFKYFKQCTLNACDGMANTTLVISFQTAFFINQQNVSW
jgi:hypothetical protein